MPRSQQNLFILSRRPNQRQLIRSPPLESLSKPAAPTALQSPAHTRKPAPPSVCTNPSFTAALSSSYCREDPIKICPVARGCRLNATESARHRMRTLQIPKLPPPGAAKNPGYRSVITRCPFRFLITISAPTQEPSIRSIHHKPRRNSSPVLQQNPHSHPPTPPDSPNAAHPEPQHPEAENCAAAGGINHCIVHHSQSPRQPPPQLWLRLRQRIPIQNLARQPSRTIHRLLPQHLLHLVPHPPQPTASPSVETPPPPAAPSATHSTSQATTSSTQAAPASRPSLPDAPSLRQSPHRRQSRAPPPPPAALLCPKNKRKPHRQSLHPPPPHRSSRSSNAPSERDPSPQKNNRASAVT